MIYCTEPGLNPIRIHKSDMATSQVSFSLSKININSKEGNLANVKQQNDKH
jgi:hypothetical protein